MLKITPDNFPATKKDRTHLSHTVMAGWLHFSDFVIICLLVSHIAAHLLVKAPKLPMNGNLQFLSIAQDNSRP